MFSIAVLVTTESKPQPSIHVNESTADDDEAN